MAPKKWIVGSPDRELAKNLAQEFDIDPFTALLACGRGVTDPCDLEVFLSNEPLLCDPNELVDIQKAAEIVNTAIKDDTLIAIFGDYDCDGIVATAIMYDYLASRDARVMTYIPDRIEEGYGMNKAAIDKLSAQGVGLIITVDNGISCIDEIEYANSLGIKTVVTDHHLPGLVLPAAAAVVDPHRADCPSQFKEICGAQVAFKTICVIDDKEPEQLLYRYADLLSVAIVGDVMPLVNENRCMVREGIKVIKARANTGIAAILSVAGVDRDSVNAVKISFGVVPRINAAGRMGDATRALDILNCKNMLNAIELANILDNENAKRQQIEREVTMAAIEQIEANGYKYDRVIVVEGSGWHCGIVGIVASRICEKYGKPTFVLSLEDGVAHGSGRSLSGFHLHNAVSSCADHLIKFGGHELAAGVSLNADKIGDFRKAINDYAYNIPYVVPKLNLDFKINPKGMSVDMADAIKLLEPFGMGNPTPLFGIFGVRLDKINPIASGKHLKLLFSKDGGAFQALLFGVTAEQFCFLEGDILDLAVSLDTNLYRDEYTLSVQIKAIRVSEIDDEAFFDGVMQYDDYMSGRDADVKPLFPTRKEVGAVYKYISTTPSKEERIKYIFANEIGCAKVEVAIKTLCELGLVKLADGRLVACKAEKTELTNSPTYKLLYERVNGN